MRGIKACPFCGGDACLHSRYTNKYRCFFVYVKCEICGATAKTVTDHEDPEDKDWRDYACECAVRAWNLRAQERI